MVEDTIQYLPLNLIDTASQVRENAMDDGIRGLAATLKEKQYQPIRVRRSGERFVVIDGERRLHAARQLKWDRISAMVDERELSAAEVTVQQLVMNCMRKALSGIEFGRACHALIKETGWSASEVAKRLGCSVATVTRSVDLIGLPPDIQEKVLSGALPASTAYALAKVADPDEQAQLANEAARGKLTRDAAAAAVKKSKRGRKSTKRSRQRGVDWPIGEKCRMKLTGTGELKAFVASLHGLIRAAESALAGGLDWNGFMKVLREQPKSQS